MLFFLVDLSISRHICGLAAAWGEYLTVTARSAATPTQPLPARLDWSFWAYVVATLTNEMARDSVIALLEQAMQASGSVPLRASSSSTSRSPAPMRSAAATPPSTLPSQQPVVMSPQQRLHAAAARVFLQVSGILRAAHNTSVTAAALPSRLNLADPQFAPHLLRTAVETLRAYNAGQSASTNFQLTRPLSSQDAAVSATSSFGSSTAPVMAPLSPSGVSTAALPQIDMCRCFTQQRAAGTSGPPQCVDFDELWLLALRTLLDKQPLWPLLATTPTVWLALQVRFPPHASRQHLCECGVGFGVYFLV